MRLHFVLLLASAALLAIDDAASKTTDLKVDFSSSVRSLAAELNTVPATRLLRTGDTTEEEVGEEEEERAINFKSIPGFDKVKNIYIQNKMNRYLKKDMSVDEVFAKLKLGKVTEDLFQNPKFIAWMKYVADYNAKNPTKQVFEIPTLSKQYGDDVLARMLDAASKVPGTMRSALNLQKQQVMIWRNENLTLDDVFSKLKLTSNLDDILSNPSFFAFNRYLPDYNYRHSTSVTMVEVLQHKFGDIRVAKMLETATTSKVKSTSKIAETLQKQQLELWRDLGRSSDNVFKMLNLESKVGNAFESPNFLVWAKFHKEYSGERTSYINALWDILGEKKLVAILLAPKKANGNPAVGGLQNALIQKFMALKRTPDQVAELVGASSLEAKTFNAAYRWNFYNKQ
uniref:RxLR effector protein n=1 Tax=Phytophthora agathidicida TaxID=1642459 RepID=A0A7G4WI45_9STRA|nr:PaRXLR56 [Phytophthora agathidicida]